MTKIAQMAHDGLARTINPCHTMADGDTIFAVATGAISTRADHGAIGALAADVMAQAVVRAVKSARGLPGLPARLRGCPGSPLPNAGISSGAGSRPD